MPAKKGKSKKESAGKSNAEVARLTLLRTQEAEAESFLGREKERRQREEVEERIAFLCDEHVRALREKDSRLDEAARQLESVTAARGEDYAMYELQLRQLSNSRDVLAKERDLSKAEMEELRTLAQKERSSTAMQIAQLRETIETERGVHDEDRQRLRAQACEALAEAEVLRQRLQRVSEEKAFQERSHNLQQREVARDLEKAVATSKAMREALEERDADGRKNVALLQLLNAQLEADTRRHETEMAAEQERTRRAKEDVERLTTACSTAYVALDTAKREAMEAKHAAETELHELRALMEQVKFDAAYLHRELDAVNAEHSEAAEKAERHVQALQAKLRQTQVGLEAATKENEEVKALLLRKEREHFDTVTFLNAQVSNGRTTIAQLRDELQRQRDHHEKDRNHLKAVNAKAMQDLEKHILSEAERNEARHVYEQELLTEATALKARIAELQAQLESCVAAQEQLRASQEDEIARLRGILDAHFIPNRQEVEVSRESVHAGEVFLLKEELRTLEEKAAQREKVRQETESQLRSRIADQMDVIAALQLDLKRTQLAESESVRTLEKELGRLRKTLEVHRIAED
jgi:hypothetical protein